MSQKTGISWTHHTFNSHWGCSKVSPGCDNCYAETLASRYRWDIWGPGKSRRTFKDDHWNQLRAWNGIAKKEGLRRRVFYGSMMDWADKEAPAGTLDRMWPLIKECEWLTFLMLTKRPKRAQSLLPKDWSPQNYPNVWQGTSVESGDYGFRAEEIAQIPAAVHFISAEPLLGPLDAMPLTDIEWVIVGGESGRGYRTMREEWVQDLLDRCLLDNVAFFYKQGNGFRSGTNPYFKGVEYKQFPAVPYEHAPPYEHSR